MAQREDLEAELAALNARLSGGLSQIRSGDRQAQYDLGQVRNRRDEIRKELSGLDRQKMPRRVYVRDCG